MAGKIRKLFRRERIQSKTQANELLDVRRNRWKDAKIGFTGLEAGGVPIGTIIGVGKAHITNADFQKGFDAIFAGDATKVILRP